MSVMQAQQEALPVAGGVAFLAYLGALAPDIVLGAFAGSVIFLLGTHAKSKWLWLLYFIVAFLAGLLGAATASDIAEEALRLSHIKATVPDGFGALIAASLTVSVLGWLRDNPALLLLRKLKGGTV